MSIESAKNFLLNVDVSSEITDVVERTILDNKKKKEKLNMIVDEAGKRGYNFNLDDLKRAVEDFSSISDEDLSNIAGGSIKNFAKLDLKKNFNFILDLVK